MSSRFFSHSLVLLTLLLVGGVVVIAGTKSPSLANITSQEQIAAVADGSTTNVELPELFKLPPCGTKGDVNEDGKITLSDAEAIRDSILGNPFRGDLNRGDVTGEGDVSVLDVTFINRYLVGLDDTFPVCSPSTTYSKIPFTPKPRTIISSPLVTSCGTITKSGSYQIVNDIVSDNGNCIEISNVNDVSVSCNGKTITGGPVQVDIDAWYYGGLSAIVVDTVKDFSLRGCILKGDGPNGKSFAVNGVDGGIITGNTFKGGEVGVAKSHNVLFSGNTFDSSTYGQDGSNGTLFKENILIFDPKTKIAPMDTIPANIAFFGGSDNKIIKNTVDGGAIGTGGLEPGADDAILASDEKGLLIEDNILKNVWDCGIETINTIEDSIIRNNQLINTGFCGIGGWYESNWKRNRVTGNTVRDADNLFTFSRFWGLRPGEDGVYFTDNIFEDNTISWTPNRYNTYSTIFIPQPQIPGPFPGARVPLKNEIFAHNNRFARNDFGPGWAPSFYPNSLVVDGGGNKCGEVKETYPSSIVNYPLNCGKTLVCGDADGSGQVTTLDISLIRRHILGIAELPKEKVLLVDVNKNGEVTTLDIVLIRRHILGLDTTPLQCAASL